MNEYLVHIDLDTGSLTMPADFLRDQLFHTGLWTIEDNLKYNDLRWQCYIKYNNKIYWVNSVDSSHATQMSVWVDGPYSFEPDPILSPNAPRYILKQQPRDNFSITVPKKRQPMKRDRGI